MTTRLFVEEALRHSNALLEFPTDLHFLKSQFDAYKRSHTPEPDGVWGTYMSLYNYGVALWWRAGLPTLNFSNDDLLASILTTDPPPKPHTAESLDLPWSVFRITVPEGFLTRLPGSTQPEIVRSLLVRKLGSLDISFSSATTDCVFPALLVCCCADSGISHVLVSSYSEDWQDGFGDQVRTLVLNTLALMSEQPPERVGKPAPASMRKHYARTQPERLTDTYVLGRGVKVVPGLAAEVREQLRGGGTPRKVRWIVRGHWRNAWVGKRGEQTRRLTWIKPHWSGDPNAPVLLRPHVLEQPA